MSGFISIVHSDGRPVDPALLRRLTEFMAFRGPDGQHTWIGAAEGGAGSVGFGHALLRSTFESSQEHQPATLDDHIWIVADARVDGRAELLRELRARGRSVADSAPDHELILHAYHVWGQACVQHLIGDFAFVIWDSARACLFVARDQFGVTPFYYARVASGLICSNTLACLRRHPDVPATLDESAIGDDLLFGGFLDQTATLFAAIRSLPPAHTLVWSRDQIKIERYWSLPQPNRYLDFARPEEYAEQFLALMRQSVGDRLRVARAGISMSGGLDSTTIAVAAVQAQGDAGSLHAYTWVYDWLFPDDERQYAGQAAAMLGIPITFLSSEDSLATDQAALAAFRSPVPLAFAQPRDGRLFLRQFAAQGSVMLAGTGGDVALYRDTSYWLKRLARGQLGGLWMDIQRHRQAFGRRPPIYWRDLLRLSRRRPLWRSAYPAWLDPGFEARHHLPARFDWFANTYQVRYNRSRVAESTWAQPFMRLDPGHTGVPVKVRHPFFDLRLLDFLFRVPAVPWFVDKYLVRTAMRGLLPEAVRRRRKQSLASWPYHALAIRQGRALPWLEQLAQGPELSGMVDQPVLLGLLRAPQRSTASSYQAVVHALSLADVLRQEAQIDSLRAAGPTASF